MKRNKPPKIGLALSGGAVRGFAHIGVIEALCAAGIPIDAVAGTSVGSLMGAAFCAAMPLDQIRELAAYMNWSSLANPTLSRYGLLSFKKLEHYFKFMLGDLHFDDLNIPFAAVTTDLDSGKPVILRQGEVARAVRASCSIPGLVAPVEINGRKLVDGGISDNLPVDVARDLGADYVIGVDLMEPHLRPFVGPMGAGIFSVATMIQRSGGAPEQADCLITPKVGKLAHLVNFRNGDELIRLGYEAAQECVPGILADLHLK